MKTFIEKIIYTLTNSIRKKLILCFLLIIIVLVSTSIYTYVSGKVLNDLYNSALEKHLQLNNLFMNLSLTNDLLEKYLKSGSPEMFEKYNKAYPLLLESAQSFENSIKDENGIRIATDFKYMIQSYTEEANYAIVYLKESNLAKSNEHYFGARDIYKLINGYFNKVFSILVQDTNNIKYKIIDNRTRFYTLNGFLIVFIGAFCIIFMQAFSSSITKPIRNLTTAASRLSKGETDIPEVPVTSNDETSILTLTFNNMVKKINMQISEIKEKVELERKLKDEEMENLKIKSLLKESELKTLQSRINPHFLFNSLNMISQTAFLEGASQTTSLLESMSDLLRYNLDKFSKVVTIEDEIGNLKDYVFIQRKRFGERIKFEIKEDMETYKSLIPCLIIQPLVENSIIHGVGSFTQNGFVCVEVQREGDRVKIRIIDNGVGIEKSKLDILERMLSNAEECDNADGIGLYNVYTRLKLFYNGDIKVKISSNPASGTWIELDVPYKDREGSELCIA